MPFLAQATELKSGFVLEGSIILCWCEGSPRLLKPDMAAAFLHSWFATGVELNELPREGETGDEKGREGNMREEKRFKGGGVRPMGEERKFN